MKNLAIIGASYLQVPLIEKAKEMGFTTHVFAWAANDVGERVADFFYPISITEVEEIEKKCREIKICGICSIATDLGNYTVNYVASRLGLPGNSMACTEKSTNKHLMRKAFEEHNDPSPKSLLVNDGTDLNTLKMDFPVIVKPTDRSGSRGITKVDKTEDLEPAVKMALDVSFEKKALIEEFAQGKEYSVEGISYHGKHQILAMTEKFTTGAPHFIETGHREPAEVSEDTFQRVKEIVAHALDSLEIRDSASHSEIKIDDQGKIKIIEIGSRMGGDCIGSDLVELTTGIDYLKAVIQVACGEAPELEPKEGLRAVEVRYILTEADMVEYKRMCSEEPQRIIRTMVNGKYAGLTGKATDSSNRAGCYIIRV